MKRPRILMIAPLPPPVHGSAMMTQYIKDSEFINERICIDWINLSTSRSMDEIGKKSLIKYWRFALAYIKTFCNLLTHRYDACYIALTCHGNGFIKDAPFALLCKLFGKKLIIHQHNKGMSKDVDKQVFRWLFQMVYKNSTVILLSWRLYPDIEKIVSREQVRICPNGIPETDVYSRNESQSTIPQILFLSNLIESKGVLVLLDACKILKEKGYLFNCRFVGGETKEIDASRFQKEVEKRGLNDFVKYAGKKYGKDKYKEFSDSDMFVFPTYYKNECFPLVLLEAIQQKIPVVSTTEGGIPDIVKDGDTGLLVEPENAIDLAIKIESLINNPDLRHSIGMNGFNNYKKNYTLDKFQENICQELLLVCNA